MQDHGPLGKRRSGAPPARGGLFARGDEPWRLITTYSPRQQDKGLYDRKALDNDLQCLRYGYQETAATWMLANWRRGDKKML